MSRVIVTLALLFLTLHWLKPEAARLTVHMQVDYLHCVVPAGGNASLIFKLLNGRSCSTITLTELISSTIKSNTTVIFLSGKHLMPKNKTFYVENVQELVLTGQENSTNNSLAEIDCQGSEGAFQLLNIVNLSISNLKFTRCGRSLSHGTSNKQTMATLFLANITNLFTQELEIVSGLGYGLYGLNIVGHSTITHSHFVNNTNGGNALLEYTDQDRPSCMRLHHLLIEHSSFRLGQSLFLSLQPDLERDNIGAGLSIQLHQVYFSVNITLLRTNASGNIAGRGASFQVDSNSCAPNIVTLQDCVASNGTVLFASGSGFAYSYYQSSMCSLALTPCRDTIIPNRTWILLNNSRFTDNKGGENPSDWSEFASNAISAIVAVSESTFLQFISVLNCDIANNIGDSGVGFYGQVSSEPLFKGFVEFEIVGSSFRNNTSTSFQLDALSIVYVNGIDSVKVSNISVSDNTGTAINSINSNVYFEGTNILFNNSAYNGGGIALHGSSFVMLKPHTHITLASNKASNVGGGVYVAQLVDTTVAPLRCFFQFYDFNSSQDIHSVDLHFFNNTAGLAGSDLFGGSLEICLTSSGKKYQRFGHEYFPYITGTFQNRTTLDVSSKPVRACLCNVTSNEPVCSKFAHSIAAFPGGAFHLSVITVGQMLFNSPSGTPSAIFAGLLPNHLQGSIPEKMQAQGVGRHCSPLPLAVNSRNANEIIVLTVEKAKEKQRNQKMIAKAEYWYTDLNTVLDFFIEIPLYINVTLLPCPLGFQLTMEGMCGCAGIFREYDISCSIDTNTLHREPPMWIGTKYAHPDSENSTPIYMIHPNCPYDYCISSSVNVALGDSDVQCTANRTGLLCGACKDGLSSVLGGSQCRNCSSMYILLLIPFILAGVLLICLLLGINLTVTVGTINGLLFYANIVRENHTTLFPFATDPNILAVFIAWLNLDFGITACFYDGMDTYAKAWLQFVFPVYIWLLAAIIIVSSHYSMTIAKLRSKNIIQVLVTLFLLSHTKLQRAIITGLSFAVVKRSDNNTEFVWLPDPTLSYVQGKHIALFIASMAFFVCLFLPYTFTILFGPCLLAKTNYRLFSCIHKLKPFFDAYFGPYKDKHRYWMGLLLFARVVLVVLSAVNVFGDPSVNLLAASIVSYVLIVLLWQSGGVYKLWILNYLESFFFLNLGLLSTVSLYIRLSGGSQYAATHISYGLAFTVFSVIIVFHILVYTPINITERSCTKHIASKLSFLQHLHTSLSSQDTNISMAQRRYSRGERLDLVDIDRDGHGSDTTSCYSDSDEEKKMVSSMLISFDNLEPTFQLTTVQR